MRKGRDGSPSFVLYIHDNLTSPRVLKLLIHIGSIQKTREGSKHTTRRGTVMEPWVHTARPARPAVCTPQHKHVYCPCMQRERGVTASLYRKGTVGRRLTGFLRHGQAWAGMERLVRAGMGGCFEPPIKLEGAPRRTELPCAERTEMFSEASLGVVGLQLVFLGELTKLLCEDHAECGFPHTACRCE